MTHYSPAVSRLKKVSLGKLGPSLRAYHFLGYRRMMVTRHELLCTFRSAHLVARNDWWLFMILLLVSSRVTRNLVGSRSAMDHDSKSSSR